MTISAGPSSGKPRTLMRARASKKYSEQSVRHSNVNSWHSPKLRKNLALIKPRTPKVIRLRHARNDFRRKGMRSYKSESRKENKS